MLSHGPGDDKEEIPSPLSNPSPKVDDVAVLESADDGRLQRALAGPAPHGGRSTDPLVHPQRKALALARPGPLARNACQLGAGHARSAAFAAGGLAAFPGRAAACARRLRATPERPLEPDSGSRAPLIGRRGPNRGNARGPSLNASGMKAFSLRYGFASEPRKPDLAAARPALQRGRLGLPAAQRSVRGDLRRSARGRLDAPRPPRGLCSRPEGRRRRKRRSVAAEPTYAERHRPGLTMHAPSASEGRDEETRAWRLSKSSSCSRSLPGAFSSADGCGFLRSSPTSWPASSRGRAGSPG